MRRLLHVSVLLAFLASPALAGAAEDGDPTAEDCPSALQALRRRIDELEDELERARFATEAIALGEHLDEPGTPDFYKHVTCAFGCVCLAALAAGLTMGLVSIEPFQLQVIVNTEDKDMKVEQDKVKLKEDKVAAGRVLPLVHDHHRLLVTLLLMNSIANEALPLFLDKLVPSWMAVMLSVSLVLMFGEIIPSAIFTGSEQLRIAAMFAPLVGWCQFILTPIVWPIAKVLDKFLGEDHKGRYNFAELRAIVGIHAGLKTESARCAIFKSIDDQEMGIITVDQPHHFSDETMVLFKGVPDHPAKSTKLIADQFYYVRPCAPLTGRDKACTFRLYPTEERRPDQCILFKKGELTSGAFEIQERDEIKIMHGVMNLTHMTAEDGHRPLSKTDMLECSEALTKQKLKDILDKGHSRIPVYMGDPHNVRGFILTKRMIVITPDDGSLVSNIDISQMVLARPDIAMLDLLNEFQKERCHIALLTDKPAEVKKAWDENRIIPPDCHMMGIITLEDIIEKLIQEEIFDEHDDNIERTPHSHAAYMTPRQRAPLDRAQSPCRATSLSQRDLPRAGSKRTLHPPPHAQPPGSERTLAPAPSPALVTTPASTLPVLPKAAAAGLQEPLLPPNGQRSP